MRILIHSSTPECNSGYGNIVREVVRRLRAAGHFVRVGTKHAWAAWKTWEGVEVFEGTNHVLVNQMLKDEHFDYVLTIWDIWLMKEVFFPKEKWAACIFVDSDRMSNALLNVVRRTGRQIAVSEHGRRELEGAGFSPDFSPCGMDTQTFRIKPDARRRFRDEFGMKDDTFVIGTVGLNYGDDRKGFIPLMQAFKRFLGFYPNSALYIHTHALGAYPGTIDYRAVAEYLGIADRVCWPHQLSNDIGRIDQDWLADVYNGMDVFCLATKGEGFGIPIIEAQACGTPVAVTATTTGPELCLSGRLIRVNDDDLRWQGTGTFRHEPRPSEIYDALLQSWEGWIAGARGRERVRAGVIRYDWENVWPTFWAPVIRAMEAGAESGAVSMPAASHGAADVLPAA